MVPCHEPGKARGGHIYRKWVSIEEDDEVSEQISGVKWPVCLGPQAFIDQIKEKYGSGKINKEIPSSHELLPGKKRLLLNLFYLFQSFQ